MESSIIRHSVGIDVAKEDFKVCYGYINTNMKQRIVAEAAFDNTLKGYEDFALWLSEGLISVDELYFAMEATGVYHEALCHFLYDRGFSVSVMPSGRFRKLTAALQDRSTGCKDAMCLGS